MAQMLVKKSNKLSESLKSFLMFPYPHLSGIAKAAKAKQI